MGALKLENHLLSVKLQEAVFLESLFFMLHFDESIEPCFYRRMCFCLVAYYFDLLVNLISLYLESCDCNSINHSSEMLFSDISIFSTLSTFIALDSTPVGILSLAGVCV